MSQGASARCARLRRCAHTSACGGSSRRVFDALAHHGGDPLRFAQRCLAAGARASISCSSPAAAGSGEIARSLPAAPGDKRVHRAADRAGFAEHVDRIGGDDQTVGPAQHAGVGVGAIVGTGPDQARTVASAWRERSSTRAAACAAKPPPAGCRLPLAAVAAGGRPARRRSRHPAACRVAGRPAARRRAGGAARRSAGTTRARLPARRRRPD